MMRKKFELVTREVFLSINLGLLNLKIIQFTWCKQSDIFLCLKSTQEIVGTFNISNIVRGYFQSAYLGYEVFSPHQRKGYMSQGLKLLLHYAFTELNLHRLEANVQPENTYSIRLLAKSGFIKEGYSKNYLNVGNQGWRDHERWAIVNDEWQYKHS
jgi:ribosomal-protein-alanine N-acetyltransferase